MSKESVKSEGLKKVKAAFDKHKRAIASDAILGMVLYFAKNGMPDENFSKSCEIYADKILDGEIEING